MQLTLENGAIWYNAITPEQKDQQNKVATAKIGYLRADQGVIDMTGSKGFTVTYVGMGISPTELVESTDGLAGDAVVNHYSGSSTVLYKHDITAPADPNEGLAIQGGDLKIGKADETSVITLRTDGAGLKVKSTGAADRNLVSGTLNNLAKKLFYEAYKDGERNLTGKVEIAEGLTAQSVGYRLENMTFREEDGQGQYLYEPAVENPIPDEQTVDTFSTAITGDKTVDHEYVQQGVLKNDVYTFTKDTTTINASVRINGGVWELAPTWAAVSNTNADLPTVLDLKGHALNINSDHFSGIAATARLGHLEINNAGAISINVGGDKKNYVAGVYANTGSVVDIHNGGPDQENKILKIRAGFDSDWTGGSAGIKARNGIGDGCSTINIDGLVDIEVDGDTSNDHPGGDTFGGKTAVSSTASEINIGGGSIKVKKWVCGALVL